MKSRKSETRVEADGRKIAAEIKAEVAAEVRVLERAGVTPGLAVVLVGHVAASEIYVRSKVKASAELGLVSETHTPPETVTTEELLALVAELNARDSVDGILIQLPLPAHVDTRRVLEAVAPEKDVDGFHPINAGRLQAGRPALAPCTPAGIMEILRRSGIAVAGKHAVVLGRSDIVGKPAALLLLNAHATVTVCHSRTVDLARYTRDADILVAAIGKAGFVTAEMVKPGATLIDVGINRITDADEVARFFPGDAARAKQFAERGSTLVGDIHPAAFAKAGAYTPVPGGVGALTIAMLMHNTVQAAKSAAPGRRFLRRPGWPLRAEPSAMLRVGLTGGLGSGKTTAARRFAELGAQVLSADEIGRALMQPGEPVYARIVETFGPGVVAADGKLDRAALARMAFGEGRIEELNAIVHPGTIARQEAMIAEIAEREPDAVVVVESALVFETKHGGEQGWRRRFDCVVLVRASEERKIARFVARAADGAVLSEQRRRELEAEARRRLAQQIDDEWKAAHSDYVLTNDGTVEQLRAQVDALWPSWAELKCAAAELAFL